MPRSARRSRAIVTDGFFGWLAAAILLAPALLILQSATARAEEPQPAPAAETAPPAAPGSSAETQPDQTKITGRLQEEQGVRILRLWGSPRDRGYAHGRLLGKRIMGFFENVILDPRLLPAPQLYEQMIRRQFLPLTNFPPRYEAELEGLLAGMRDGLGEEGMQLKRLGRTLDLDDLKALNTIADWNPSACSSFAAWGNFTNGGETVVGRNLDYFDLHGIHDEHLIIRYGRGDDGARGFVSAAWPGIIGVYTAMNEEGVVVAVHDAPAPKARDARDLIPRSLALRRIVEESDAGHALQHAEEIMRLAHTFRGNNVLVAVPSEAGDAPAIVFEYDGDQTNNNGVTARTPDAEANATPPHTLVCTNHYRCRAETNGACRRYDAIDAALTERAHGKSPLDHESTLAIMRQAAVSGTVHTMIAFPDRHECWFHFSTPETNATKNPGLRVDVRDMNIPEPGRG